MTPPGRNPIVPLVALLALLLASVSVVGVTAPGPSLPDASTPDSTSDPTPIPLRAVWDEQVQVQMDQPVPEIETGIGPGSALRITIEGEGTFLCTANFVWSDDFDRLYLGTAGHCLVPEDKTATHGPDADHDRNDTRVEVRTGACPVSGLGIACGIGGSGDPWVRLGATSYAISTGLGGDFGLVEIPPDLHGEVRYDMPAWGGPTGEGSMGGGESVLHYGHGVAYAEAFLTRARAGVSAGSGSTDWTAVGISNRGDSGSAVVTGNGPADALSGADAVGVLTHGIGAQGVGFPGLFFGTNLDTAKQLTHEHTGLRVWTLPGGAPLDGLEPPEQEEGANETLGPGTVVIKHGNEEPTTKTHTYHWNNDWRDVRLMINVETEQGEAVVTFNSTTDGPVYAESIDRARAVDEILRDMPQGPWTIEIAFENHVGSLALRIEQAEPEPGAGDEDDDDGDDGGGKDPDPSSERQRTENAPVPGLIALLANLGLVLALRRSSSRR